MVEIFPDPKNKSKNIVKITEKGKEVTKEFVKIINQIEDEIFSEYMTKSSKEYIFNNEKEEEEEEDNNSIIFDKYIENYKLVWFEKSLNYFGKKKENL